jgi:predicted ATPase/DNA-binding XRE family transcriptional regulator
MSQETLAEAAGISAAAVSALERGSRQAPYRETAMLLANALRLSEEERREFAQAAADARTERMRAHRDENLRSFPVYLGAFVGREPDIKELSRLLAVNRFVTLTGAGGIGKTRVALEVILRRVTSRDEVNFVDLAPIGDGTLILRQIASVIGASLTDRDEQMRAITSAVRQRSMLLIVDNCEHLLGDVSLAIDAILQSCANVKVLATSRQRIGIPGEVVYRLPTLPLPARGVVVTADNAQFYGAIDLFVRRAQALDSTFVLTDEHASVIADICRRLDGIPLAIEFAAARMPSLGLPMRLNERFDLLTGAAPTVPARQQTLHAAIAWSCDLLEPRERELTTQLSIFRDGWTVEAAEETCDLGYENLDELLDDLSSLVEKSIVSLDGNAGPTRRYRLLEPIREYASDLLEPSDLAALSKRHAEWAARIVERWTDMQFTRPRLLWYHEIEEESANVRTAITWALGPAGDATLAARIAAAPRTIWSEKQLIEAILAGLDAERYPSIAARLWWRLGGEYSGVGKVRAARNAIALFDRIGDLKFLGISYSNLAIGLARSGDLNDGEDAIRKALEIYQRAGFENSLVYAFGITTLGDIYFLQGRIGDQRGALKRALSLATALDDEWLVVRLRLSLGEVEFLAGNLPSAVQLTEEILLATDRPAFRRERMIALCYLAAFRLGMNLPGEAATAALQAMDLAREREPIVVARAVGYLAAVSALRDKPLQAARLRGYFEAWCARESYLPNAMEAASADIVMRFLHAELPPEDIASLAAEGASFTEQRAMAEARL